MLLFGRSLVSCFETYFIQMGEYNNLVYSAPTIYNFFDINESDLIVRTGLLYSILIIGVICYYFYDRTTLTCANFMLKFSTLFLMIIPFLLPKMHDRYFMLADVFTALCTIIDKKYFISFMITCSCSTIMYFQFLFNSAYIDSRLLTIIMLIGILYFIKNFNAEVK